MRKTKEKVYETQLGMDGIQLREFWDEGTIGRNGEAKAKRPYAWSIKYDYDDDDDTPQYSTFYTSIIQQVEILGNPKPTSKRK